MGRKKEECRSAGGGTLVGVLVALLAAAAVWQAETGYLFRYRGQARWSGPWNSPNTFGMLMGAGIILAAGLLVQSLRSKGQSRPSAECGVRNSVSERWVKP